MKQLGWILSLWGLATMLLSAAVKEYDFNLTEGMPAHIVMDFEKQNLRVTVATEQALFEHFEEPPEDLQEEPRVLEDFTAFSSSLENVIFKDNNFDGYRDFGLLMGIGYSGENEYRDYYFYNPVTKQYRLEIKHACNLEIFSKRDRMLRTAERSGGTFYHDFYRIDTHGHAVLVVSGTGTWSKNEEEGMVYDYRSNVTVRVNRAFFYTHAGGKRTKVYVIKKDPVTVLDFAFDTKKRLWVKIAYKAKRKTYSGWVKSTDLHFNRLKEQQ